MLLTSRVKYIINRTIKSLALNTERTGLILFLVLSWIRPLKPLFALRGILCSCVYSRSDPKMSYELCLHQFSI